MTRPLQLHGTCVARGADGVLILGPPGAGKSDLALRLIGKGFVLVADDRVDIATDRNTGVLASAPLASRGLLEVRGLGIVRLPFRPDAVLRVVVDLTQPPERMPEPMTHPVLGLPLLHLDARGASAADWVALALDCATGAAEQIAGAFRA